MSNSGYEKMSCWVVYGQYKDREELPDGCEELCFTDHEKALKTAEEWSKSKDYENVRIEQEEREIWIG